VCRALLQVARAACFDGFRRPDVPSTRLLEIQHATRTCIMHVLVLASCTRILPLDMTRRLLPPTRATLRSILVALLLCFLMMAARRICVLPSRLSCRSPTKIAKRGQMRAPRKAPPPYRDVFPPAVRALPARVLRSRLQLRAPTLSDTAAVSASLRLPRCAHGCADGGGGDDDVD
jgi:hypothetical protein